MADNPPPTNPKNQVIYVIEHLDPELGPWSALEYACIAHELSHASSPARFLLTSVPESLQIPDDLARVPYLEVERRSVETIFAGHKAKVCLLDPAAKEELSPADGERFEIFLFGGILGMIYLFSTCVEGKGGGREEPVKS
jgi:ribosome biogenesis SPOUT family RNA methylase Rps3